MLEGLNLGEVLAFVLYFAAVITIGLVVFLRSRNDGERDYFLGGRNMGPWVVALSAQASDMSGWLLMGFPGSILALGFGKVWIGVGLAIGTYLNWRFTAARLRRFSKVAGDAITVPQYLSNRFMSSSPVLKVVSAVVFMICFTIYVASGFKAGGTLFSSVLNIGGEKGQMIAMLIFAAIIILYTFTGGFKAVCLTDFVQGMMMLVAMIAVPIIAMFVKDIDFSTITAETPNYFHLLPSGRFDWESVSSILSGLAWGLGYFGMPHIIVRFMSIRKSSMIKTSRIVASVWVLITLSAAVVIAVIGRVVMPELVQGGSETVFISLVRELFPPFIAGILLSAILAAAMSTADSQLLVASSSVTSDIYKPFIRKQATDKELIWVGRIVVIVIAVVAFFIARNPNSGGIMDLVENAWAGFGAAFGPVIILSLYWKRLTYKGAVAGIVLGGATVAAWKMFLAVPTGLYELLPGFIVGMAACIVVSLIDKKPGEQVEKMYDAALDMSIDD